MQKAPKMDRKNLGGAVHKTGTQAGAMMGVLQEALRNLEKDISADQTGLLEMDASLNLLKKEEEKLQHEVDEMIAFEKNMQGEGTLGAVLKQFDGMEDYLKDAYKNVREGHKRGIDMLKKEFNYHPAYKLGRAQEFTASYFTPIRDPNNPNKK